MSITPQQAQRLGFVKAVYQLGLAQSRQPGLLSSTGLLLFHDAAELFLGVVAESFGVRKEHDFMKLWGLIDEALENQPAGRALPQKESMRRLKTARVNLKHDGFHPAPDDLKEYATTITRFLFEACPLVFDVGLDGVSLLMFVTCVPAQQSLERAVREIEADKTDEASSECALALDLLLREDDTRSSSDDGDSSPFAFGAPLRHAFFFGGVVKADRELESFLASTAEAVTAIQQSLRILGRGLDFRKYVRFKRLTPMVVHFMDGSHKLLGARAISKVDAQFCVDFTIECALRLQELDLRVEAGPSGEEAATEG